MSPSHESRVDELYIVWRDRRDQKQPLSAAELCNQQGCPELAESLCAYIEGVADMEQGFLALDRSANPTDPDTGSPGAADSSQGVQIPGFTILGEIGRGGMGVVYKARQDRLDRVVALKMVRNSGLPDGADAPRFLREARAVAQLHHDNIVQIYDADQHNGQPYYYMEFMEGGSLASSLRGRRCGAEESARLVLALARALDHAHQQGIVHRDLKPANVFLSADGTPKVGDFGLAKRLNDPDRLTQAGAILGTPAYMAPEQASGKAADAGPAADVYALGAILYELLCGEPPFRGDDTLGLLKRVRSEPPPAPSRVHRDVPRDLEKICLRCLQKSPGDRYPSALALAEELQRYLDGRHRGHWRAFAALGAALVALVGTALIAWGIVSDLKGRPADLSPSASEPVGAGPATVGKPRLAVLYFENHSADRDRLGPLEKGLCSMMIAQISAAGEYQVVERERLEEILKEQRLGRSGQVDPRTAARLGRLLGAQHLILGSYFELLQKFRIDARIVDVETGITLAASSVEGTPDGFGSLLSELTADLVTKHRGAGTGSPGRVPSRASLTAAVQLGRALDALDRGDRDRARKVLDEVLREAPELEAARTLDSRLKPEHGVR